VRRVVFICLTAAVVVASACTGSDQQGTDGGDQGSEPDKPVAGGHAIVGVFGEPPTFDPYAPDATDLTHALLRPVYRSLFRVGPDGAVVPDLAEDIETSGDRARVRLARARWSNGRSVTARDVVATVVRATPPSGFARVASARAIARRTIELRGPVRNWKATLARTSFVLPGGRHSEPGGVFGGPYVIRRIDPGLEVIYEPSRYWNPPSYLKRVTVRFVTNLLMMLRLLEDGRLDAAALPSSVNLEDRLRQVDLNSESALGYETVVLDFASSGLSRAERVGIVNRLPMQLMQEGLIRDDGRISRTLYPTPESAAGPYGRVPGSGVIPAGQEVMLAPAGDELLQLIQRVIDARLDRLGVTLDLVRLVPSDLYGGHSPVAGIEVLRVAGGPGGRDSRAAVQSLNRYPLFLVETVIAWRSGLHGIEVNPTFEGPLDNLHEWWWTTGARSEASL
jgi:hypothetical protein